MAVIDYHDVEREFGALARDSRKRKRLSQQDVAEAMSSRGFPMHQTTLAKLERGQRPLRMSEAVALSDILLIPWAPFIPGQWKPR